MFDERELVHGGGEKPPPPLVVWLTRDQCLAEAEKAKAAAVPLLERAGNLKRLHDESANLADFWSKIALAYLMMSGMPKGDAEREVKSWRPFSG